MATVNGIAKTNNTNAVAAKAASGLGVMIGSKSVQERFEKMLGKKSAGTPWKKCSFYSNLYIPGICHRTVRSDDSC